MTTLTTMIFSVSTQSSSRLVYPSSSSKASSLYAAFSNAATSTPKNGIFVKCFPRLDSTPFSQWNGLKLVGSSISECQVKIVKERKYKHKGAYASLFGFGAPEVLVVGVVALIVFGPKGLAEAARSLGKTMRAFQPTIQELQEVSMEFKSTLEREIGLDDVDNPTPKHSASDSTKLMPEGSRVNIRPNGYRLENGHDYVDNDTRRRAEQLRQALIKLQKEQEEEREREENEKAAI